MYWQLLGSEIKYITADRGWLNNEGQKLLDEMLKTVKNIVVVFYMLCLVGEMDPYNDDDDRRQRLTPL